MDHAQVAFDTFTEDAYLADRKRLDAFRLGKSMPTSSTNNTSHKPSHARSHSRKASSVSISPMTTSLNSSLSSLASTSLSMNDTPPQSPTRSSLGSKRNSHHRRRSSVSTRHESAEMMGISLPSLPQSNSDDNINLGDKDSIRRRALWTLEGKTDVGSFSKVAIPELGTPEVEKKPFDFPSKPSYPPGIGAGYSGLSSLMGNKRDSKFMPSSSSKEQLGTLVEEEEEEEDEIHHDQVLVSSPVEEVPAPALEATITPPSVSPVSPPRHRPASLNLRPLSLVAATAVQASSDLPTPTPSPSPSAHPGLKSLSLPSSASLEVSSPDPTDDLSPSARRRHSYVFGSSPSSPAPPARRPSLNIDEIQVPPASAPPPQRRSSIGYVSSPDPPIAMPTIHFGLPTPEMTPVSERRQSTTSVDSDLSRGSSRGSRPLSTIEQHFLFQAHQTLVQRISDLERALSARPRSRPQSYASDVSTHTEPPSDEILQLIADLKAERDELKRDVDGWRTRLSDSEKQVTLLLKRVEAERREAWVARERVGLLEIEKRSLESTVKDKTSWGDQGWKNFRDAQNDFQKAVDETESLRPRAMKAVELEIEVAKLKAELERERRKKEDVEKELESVLATPTPRTFEFKPGNFKIPSSKSGANARKGGLGFRSIDSTTSSFTDVDEADGACENPFPLKAVEEEDENGSISDGEDELARYEEEDENDAYVFHDSSSVSSFGSIRDFQQASTPNTSTDIEPQLTSRSNTASPASPIPTPEPAHGRHKSLSRVWTFPQATDVSPAFGREVDEVDRFFGCLEDVDNSPPLGCRLRSEESSKNLFSEALGADDDELPPFVLPSHVGIEVVVEPEPAPRTVLDVVVEEDEEDDDDDGIDDIRHNSDDEFVGEEVEGGIIFTFNPPETFDSYMGPVDIQDEDVFEPVEEEHSSSFTLSRERIQEIASSPSSIPRFASAKTRSSPSPSTPVKSNSFKFPATSDSPSAVTPPKRSPSTFIPQPRSRSSSPFASKEPAASFIRQPNTSPPSGSKIPVSSSNGHFSPQAKTSMSMHEDTITSRPPCPSPEMRHSPRPESTPASPIPVSDVITSPTLRFMSPTLATRFSSIQKLTNFLPMPSLTSWTPRSPALGSAASAAASALCIIPSSSGHLPDDTSFAPSSPIPIAHAPKERGFVSKERQLEKLRLRLEQEQRIKTGTTVCASRDVQDGLLHI